MSGPALHGMMAADCDNAISAAGAAGFYDEPGLEMPMPYRQFRDFYPYYLSEHRNRSCRRLHFLGSGLVLAVLAWALLSGRLDLLWLLPLIGYGFA